MGQDGWMVGCSAGSFPRRLLVGQPLHSSGDKAAQGIIHLPAPFSISATLAGTFCPLPAALKHKIPSVRNSSTHSSSLVPFSHTSSSSSSSLDYKCATGNATWAVLAEQSGGKEKKQKSEKILQLKKKKSARGVVGALDEM